MCALSFACVSVALFALIAAKPVLRPELQQQPCKPGYYFVTPTKCAQCPAGSFQPKPAQPGCIPCAAGTISTDGGATSCQKCAPTAIADASRTRCVCPDGSEKQPDGSCVMCKAGNYLSRFGKSGECIPCQRDSYQPDAGQLHCLPCDDNAYSDDGAVKCVQCAPGEVFLGGNKCGKCAAGETYLESTRECAACTSGTFKASVGSGPCIRCPPRGFSNEGATACTMCPKGSALMADGKCGDCPAGSHYNVNTKTCTKCTPGTFSRQRNAMLNCFACAGDSFSFAGATECVTCAPHTALMKNGSCGACAEGDFYNTEQLVCEPCPINAVSAGGTMSFCFPCVGGSFAKPRSAVCEECGEGKVLLARTLTCETCPEGTNYYAFEGICA